MSVIVYRRYSFKEPAPITINQYLYIKQQVTANNGFEIDGDNKITFSSHYKKSMFWCLIGLVVGVGAILLHNLFFDTIPGQTGAPEIVEITLVIAGGITVFATFIRILLEGPSMATFLTDRKLYFGRMKHAIRHHVDYPAFYTAFYGDGKKDISGVNAPFRQEALHDQNLTPPSMDRLLTSSFAWIDRHAWKFGLAILAAFLLWKYIIK